jgi:hypothetical protein
VPFHKTSKTGSSTEHFGQIGDPNLAIELPLLDGAIQGLNDPSEVFISYATEVSNSAMPKPKDLWRSGLLNHKATRRGAFSCSLQVHSTPKRFGALGSLAEAEASQRLVAEINAFMAPVHPPGKSNVRGCRGHRRPNRAWTSIQRNRFPAEVSNCPKMGLGKVVAPQPNLPEVEDTVLNRD